MATQTQEKGFEDIEAKRGPLDSLVARMAKNVDPEGYKHPRMTDHKRKVAAVLQDNLLRAWNSGKFNARMNDEAYALFKQNNLLFSQRSGNKLQETTTTNSVATIATQILPLITRAVAENPIFDLVESLPMTGPQANIVYFDTLFDSSGGLYANGQRVDLNDDPTYSDRTDCETEANLLRANITRETTTATEKVTGARICVTAMQDAESQYNLSLDSILGEQIVMQQMREWARLVCDDLRTMAGNAAGWTATPAGVWATLNTNEWRKNLYETMVTLDAAIRANVYEESEWAISDTTTGAILERLARPYLNASHDNGGAGTLSAAPDVPSGGLIGRWRYYMDAFFAANTILMGRRNFRLVPNAPYYFLPYQFAQNISMLFLPLTQILEIAMQTRAARKMIEPNAYGVITIT